MTQAVSRRGQVLDLTMLTLFISLFPAMSALHPRVSNEVYHLLAGLLLGGIAALSHALLHDGYLRWRQSGLRVPLMVLVYPALGILSGVIWLVVPDPTSACTTRSVSRRAEPS